MSMSSNFSRQRMKSENLLKMLLSLVAKMSQCTLHTTISVMIHTSKLLFSQNLKNYFSNNTFRSSLYSWIRASAIPLGFSFAVLAVFGVIIRKLDKIEKASEAEDDSKTK